MFLAHVNQFKNCDYIVLNQYDKKKVLVNHNGYKIVTNICPHQSSLISVNDGKGLRVCPYHNWTFDLDGNPVTSGRTSHYCKNTDVLTTEKAYVWNSLVFSTPLDFEIKEDFSNFVLMEQRTDLVYNDSRIIMDLFLDVDHIQTVHSDVYDQIGIHDTNVIWDFYKNGSCQTVEQGAEWIAVYPDTMIEWQKGSLFITVAQPVSNNVTRVHVYKYCDSSKLADWELNEFVWETAWKQDREQAENITQFTYSNLEQQKQHYRDYLAENNGTDKR